MAAHIVSKSSLHAALLGNSRVSLLWVCGTAVGGG